MPFGCDVTDDAGIYRRCYNEKSDALLLFNPGQKSLGVLQGRPLLLGPGIRQGFGEALRFYDHARDMALD